jgi:hypothetical protein
MQSRQVFNEIPYCKLQPTDRYGSLAGITFGVAALTVLFGHAFFPGWSVFQQAIGVLLVSGLSFGLCLGLTRRQGALRRVLESSVGRPQLERTVEKDPVRPNHQSKLVAWTRSGDVIELVFDSGSWMLVRGDVNDRQWRDVQRLLVWCKRVPSRAVL